MAKKTNKSQAVTDKLFNNWLNDVDQITIKVFGIGIHDLPDRNYSSAFEQGLSAQEYCSDELFPELQDEILGD
jgi:hypothetical protein